MGIRMSQPPYLKRPMVVFGVGFLVYSILVVGAFYITSIWLSHSTEWRPYVAAIPGIVLSGIFVLLHAYMRHNDELIREITTVSLAITCVLGLSAHVISITRATIGGYSEFDGATIVAFMALTFVIVSSFLSWKHR